MIARGPPRVSLISAQFRELMKANTLTPELFRKMDAYWRAANYLSVGQIYLYDIRCLSAR
jgi:phosphoketolase